MRLAQALYDLDKTASSAPWEALSAGSKSPWLRKAERLADVLNKPTGQQMLNAWHMVSAGNLGLVANDAINLWVVMLGGLL